MNSLNYDIWHKTRTPAAQIWITLNWESKTGERNTDRGERTETTSFGQNEKGSVITVILPASNNKWIIPRQTIVKQKHFLNVTDAVQCFRLQMHCAKRKWQY